MRGDVNLQQAMVSCLSLEARVPVTYPLRPIKTMADQVLATLR